MRPEGNTIHRYLLSAAGNTQHMYLLSAAGGEHETQVPIECGLPVSRRPFHIPTSRHMRSGRYMGTKHMYLFSAGSLPGGHPAGCRHPGVVTGPAGWPPSLVAGRVSSPGQLGGHSASLVYINALGL